nr:squalene monooxygenase [Cryptococcus depauperatus CBS 7855]
MSDPEIIIVGAGVVGTALAYALSHAGRKVALLERDLSEPDRIVGELLQPGGVEALAKLGMVDVLEGIDATPVEGYCVCNGQDKVKITYPALEEDGGSELLEKASKRQWYVPSTSGLKEGRSFHHGRLISGLRRKCINQAPNVMVLEATVKDLLFCEDTRRVIGVSAAFKSKEGTETKDMLAPLTIIADGCFSKFRLTPGARIPVPDTRSYFVGLILNNAELPMKNHGTVCLTPSGPVLLYQIGNEKGEVRMLVDVKGKLPSVADGSLKQYLIDNYLPYIPPNLCNPLRHALDTQRIRSMPNSYLPPSIQGLQDSLQGMILVGDAYNMRHPLTGGGMTVAWHDALLLTEYLRPGGKLRAKPHEAGLEAGREGLEDWEPIAERLREWFWERKKLSGVVNVLSMALYTLFGGSDRPDLAVLREGCFKYFELGGDCVAGPVGLLSALTPRPVILFYHFFNVAFYSIYLMLLHGPPNRRTGGALGATWMLPFNLLYSFKVFFTACIVLLPYMLREFWS